MTEDDMRTMLRAEKARAGTWAALGEQWGMTGAYLHAMGTGTRKVSDDVVRRLGWRRVETVSFEPLREVEDA